MSFWLGLAHGCGNADDDLGSAGRAGMAGARAGTAGTGAGMAGRSSAGRGGAGGTVQTAGEGGTSAGAGGEGGACLVETSPHDLANSCGLGAFGNGEYATVTTTCSFEDTCKDLGCGAPWSDFDASGCRRATCTSSATCGHGERCVPRALYESGCNPGVYERCSAESCDRCACSTSADCNSVGFCLAVADYPTSTDCNVDTSDCAAVADRLLYLELGAFTGDAADAVSACAERLHAALDVCDGVGGAAGGGGAGGEAGQRAR
jgi:hypothetical protein